MPKTDENADLSGRSVRLPNWMFWAAITSAGVLIVMLVIALADGRDNTDTEQSPFRNAPTSVLSPDG
ncbi:MAG: hypothetical protein AAF626_09630 [Pseudomonadota bacterium]